MYQIFVVEDEILIRQNIRNMVENMGGPYAFCGEAADGEMALSMMQDLMPDILLTDIKMPFLDGFELIRHAKSMMPWLKIIIISGYDEFESAQKAISLGVDKYLLKPLRPDDLRQAVEDVAAQLEKSKTQDELLAKYDKNELHNALYQQFMHYLFWGDLSTSSLLERARLLDIDVLYPFYQVALFHFDSGFDTNGSSGVLRQKIAEVLQSDRTILHYNNGSDQMVLLALAKQRDALNEKIYRIVNIIRHELADFGVTITTVIGNVVERISEVKDAYSAADTVIKKIHTIHAGQVIDINDAAQITTDIVSFNTSFDTQFQQKLLYATEEDVPALLRAFWDEAGSERFNSLLYRYYTLIDILKTAVQIVASAKPDIDQKDIAAQFSNAYDIFIASSARDTFEKMAADLLQEAVRMKQENPSYIRHSHVISQAENYISENYCDPNISLISVAKHVGLSPAHFSTIFSQTTGKTFISYLTSLRIEKAKALLAQTDMKLSAIAMEIGYNEPNYFSHVFKKSEGITPKEFRNKSLQKA